jgi:hypothetical protein
MKQYEVEYRKTSDFSDLIGIDIIKIETCDGYGIVSKFYGYKHPDGTTNVYPGCITECGLCNSIICSVEKAKQIYQNEKEFYDRWYSLQ